MFALTMKRALLASVSLLALSGCAGYQQVRDNVNASADVTAKKVAEASASVTQPKAVPLVRKSDRVWLAGKSINREKFEDLPSATTDITLHFGGRHTMASVAEIIQRATGIRVFVNPDVFISPRALAPQVAGTSTGPSPTAVRGAMGGAASVTMGPGGMAMASGDSGGDQYLDVPVNFRGSLKDFLDQVSTRLGVDWQYKDGKIDIRRFITQTFQVAALPGKTEFSSSMGKRGGLSQGASGGSGASNTGSTDSSMNVASTSAIDYWTSIESAIKAMLSPLGKVSINQATGSVTVTDIRDAVERVRNMVGEENRTLTRQVAFEVQVLSVRGNDDAEYGVDWNLVYSKLTNLAPEWTLSLATPGTLAAATSGAIGMSIVRAVNGDHGITNRTTGSSALFNAMAEVGRVNRVTSQRAITLNRQAVPVAVTSQRAYLAETVPTASSTGGTTSIGLKPGTVTTGFMMNMVPTVTDRNSMILTFSVDMSELMDLETFTSGSGTSQQTIQLPQISATQFIQRVGLKTGETLVLSGFERVIQSYDQRTLDRGVGPGVGGSFKGNQSKESLVVMITPVILEGI